MQGVVGMSLGPVIAADMHAVEETNTSTKSMMRTLPAYDVRKAPKNYVNFLLCFLVCVDDINYFTRAS